MNQPTSPTTSQSVVVIVVLFVGTLAMTGLLGTIYLCRMSDDPTLVQAAVKMIQTDPSSAMAALNLLRADAAVIAIVSGLTGVTIGSLSGFLNNTRTQAAPPTLPAGTDADPVKTQSPTRQAIPFIRKKQNKPP